MTLPVDPRVRRLEPEVVSPETEREALHVRFQFDTIYEHGCGLALGIGHIESSDHSYAVTMRRLADGRVEVLHVREMR